MKKNIKVKPQPEGTPLSPPVASTYAEVTENNTVPWSYEAALAADQKANEEAGVEPEEPVKLPRPPLPPGTRKELVDKRSKD